MAETALLFLERWLLALGKNKCTVLVVDFLAGCLMVYTIFALCTTIIDTNPFQRFTPNVKRS